MMIAGPTYAHCGRYSLHGHMSEKAIWLFYVTEITTAGALPEPCSRSIYPLKTAPHTHDQNHPKFVTSELGSPSTIVQYASTYITSTH